MKSIVATLPVALLIGFSASLAAQQSEGRASSAETAVRRGIDFLVKDALAWKKEYNCVSCHHGSLVVWAMREAQQRGHSVDEAFLGEFTRWVAESGEGKTSVPRPEGRPRALNTSAVYYALALGADNRPDDTAREGLRHFTATIMGDQIENGSWVAWPETRPPIFGPSDDTVTVSATLALLAAANSGDESARAAHDKGLEWLTVTPTDDDPQSLAMRLVLWTRIGRPSAEWEPIASRIQERQNPDGGWSQAEGMLSDAWATGQALYALGCAREVTRDTSESTDKFASSSDATIIMRGRNFLIRTQREDGSWLMTSRPTSLPGDTGSPGLVPITGAGAAWAVLGLVRSQ